MTMPDELVTIRHATHGDYRDTAQITQALKGVLHPLPGWPRMSHTQQESVDMICAKLARILNGDPSHADHWDDIAGYARLARPTSG